MATPWSRMWKGSSMAGESAARGISGGPSFPCRASSPGFSCSSWNRSTDGGVGVDGPVDDRLTRGEPRGSMR